jgi:hypothetical protein
MATQQDFEAIFVRLRSILQPYAQRLTVTADQPDNFYLDTAYSEQYKKPIFFGAVQIKKNYVSFHLMPVYARPDLLEGMSPELRKRMQGKSCFNFTKLDEKLIDELTTLTQRGFERFVEQKIVT